MAVFDTFFTVKGSKHATTEAFSIVYCHSCVSRIPTDDAHVDIQTHSSRANMASNGASFLPRLESVFYSVFDVEQGPKIVSQVPEALIATSSSSGHASGASSNTLFYASPAGSTPSLNDNDVSYRANSTSALTSPIAQRLEARSMHSPHNRESSTSRSLFHFDDISKYVIPPKALCGRLVICATKSHRILGFPVRLDEESYPRNYFLYNVCFVFERTADLSCYEPIARKVSRVLTACEVSVVIYHLDQCIHSRNRKNLAFCLQLTVQAKSTPYWSSSTRILTPTQKHLSQ